MRYGAIEPQTGLSYTEIEYDEARRLNIPQLMFVIDEDRHMLLPRMVDVKPEAAQALFRFKEKIGRNHTIGKFSSAEHLRYQVFKGLMDLFSDLGWWHKTDPDKSLTSPQAVVEPGFLNVQIDGWNQPNGIMSVAVHELDDEARYDIAAAILSGSFERGDYSGLRGVVSLDPRIRNKLYGLLAYRGVDEEALAREIRLTSDELFLRLLIDLAGQLRAAACAEAICMRVLGDGAVIDARLQQLKIQMRSFLYVAEEALGRMPPVAVPTIQYYLDRAREQERWKPKQRFVSALRAIASRNPAVSIES